MSAKGHHDLTPRESECQATIVAAAKMAGWLVHGERTSRNARHNFSTAIQGDRGWPDLALVHPEMRLVVFVENKRDKTGVIGPGQQEWIDALNACRGVRAFFLWVPSMQNRFIQWLFQPEADFIP